MTFRPPLIERRSPVRFVPGVSQGRVVTGDKQFGAAGQFKTYDWPLPRPFPYPKENRTWIQCTDLFLIGKDVQFGAAGQFKTYDWPLPSPFPYPKENRTWLQSTDLFLIGKDTQFGAPGQFKTYDWPLPRTREQGKTWTYSLNQTTLAPVVVNPLPFNQYDWATPRTAPYQNSLRTALDWFTFVDQDTFFGGSGQPPANMDWPLPKTAPASGKTWLYTLNQTTLAPTLQAPFSQSDWPIPRMALYPAQNRTWLDQVKLNLIGLDQFFSAPGQGPTYDWPTPRTAVRLQDYSWLNNLSQSTLAPFIEPMPFALYDWPLPRTVGPLVDLHSIATGFAILDEIPPPEPPIPPVADTGLGGSSARHPRRVVYEKGTKRKPKTFIDRIGEPFLDLEKTPEPVPDAASAGALPVHTAPVQAALAARLPSPLPLAVSTPLVLRPLPEDDEDDDLLLLS